jgi:integrase
MTRIKLDYVHEYLDRHGKLRRYFRRPGFKRIALPGIPGSDEFMTAYQLALAGQPPRLQIGTSRTKPGTVNAAIVGYYSSLAFRQLAPNTQRDRRGILERFREAHGDKRIALLPQEFIVRALGKCTPAMARHWLVAFRALLRFAVSEGFRVDDPTQGIKSPRYKSEGYHTWTEAEIAQYEARHPLGTRARLALALLLYTAQRRSDVITMGRQHVRDGAIAVRQQKTGATLQIPIHAELRKALDASPSEHLTFLVTWQGKPFTGRGFGNWFHKCCADAKLPEACSAHGLRKAACRRLAEAGCTAHQIAAISGHATLQEVERYTKAADQVRLARQAFAKEQRRTDVG